MWWANWVGSGAAGRRTVAVVSELDDALPDCDCDRFQLGVGAELGEDRLDVFANGVDAEEELVRYGLVLGTLRQELQHLQLAVGQRRPHPAVVAAQLGQEPRQHRRRAERLPRVGGAD